MDGYLKFYEEVFAGTGKELNPPDDYKETVIHIIRDTGLKPIWGEILMRVFGIICYNVPQEPSAVGKVLGISPSNVKAYKDRAITKCRRSARIDIMHIGITEYRRRIESTGLLHEIARYQISYQNLEKERKKFMKKYKEAGLQMEKLAVDFRDRYGIFASEAYQIARMEMCDSQPAIDLLRDFIFPERKDS